MDMGFNQHLTEKSLWLGDTKTFLSALNMLDYKGRSLAIVNLKTSGNMLATEAALNLERRLTMDKLQIDEQAIGPLDLRFSAHESEC